MNKTAQKVSVLNREYEARPLYNEDTTSLLGYQIKDDTDSDVFFLETPKWLTQPVLENAIYNHILKAQAAIHSEHIPGGMLNLFKDITKRLDSFTTTVPFDDYNRMCSFVAQGFGLSVEEARTAVTNVMNELDLRPGPSQQEEEWLGQKRTAPFGMQDPGFLAQPLSYKEVKLNKTAEHKIKDCMACALNEKEVNYVISELRNSRRDERGWRRMSLADQLSEMIEFYDPEFTPVSKETYEHLLQNHTAELSSISSYNNVNLNKTARTFAEGDKVELRYEDTRDLATKGHVLRVNKDSTYDVLAGDGEVHQNLDPSKLHEPSAEGGRIGGENYGYFDSPRNMAVQPFPVIDNPSEYADARGQEGNTISDVPNPSLDE